jgi:hypothetical protein
MHAELRVKATSEHFCERGASTHLLRIYLGHRPRPGSWGALLDMEVPRDEKRVPGTGGICDYCISRARAEPASAPLRSRTRTTHWWLPHVSCLSVSPQEDQVRASEQELPHNTEGLTLFSRETVRARVSSLV